MGRREKMGTSVKPEYNPSDEEEITQIVDGEERVLVRAIIWRNPETGEFIIRESDMDEGNPKWTLVKNNTELATLTEAGLREWKTGKEILEVTWVEHLVIKYFFRILGYRF